MKFQKYIAGVAVMLLIIGTVSLVHAQIGNVGSQVPGGGSQVPGAGSQVPAPSQDQTVTLPNPLGDTTTICGLIQKITNWLVVIAAPIAVGMILYGAFQMLLARENPKMFENGIRTIKHTAIGYGIILIGWGFIYIIAEVLGTSATSLCG